MLHIHEINVNSLSVFKTCLIKQPFEHVLKIILVSTGNRTEWSPIRSEIIRVVNKIGRLE